MINTPHKSKELLDSKKPIVISVELSDDATIQKLNKKHLDRDYPTDVLSFNQAEDLKDGSIYLGDIIVNKDQAKRQAAEYGNDLRQEIAELVEHGVLHLLGVHHDDDDDNSVHGIKVDQ